MLRPGRGFKVVVIQSLVIISALTINSFAGMIQPRRLVDSHTAGVLPRGYYDFECRVYSAGNAELGSGLMMGFNVGLTDRLDIGIMYGGEGIIGRGDVEFNELPGVQIKYRLFEESIAGPALALGFDNQGFGGSVDSEEFGYDGFVYKSPGFFLSASKNYILLNRIQFGIHGMASYSLEESDVVRWPNLTVGLDVGFNEELSFVVEYDLGFNDKSIKEEKNFAHPHRGYLNLGLRWAFTPNFYIEFDAKDVLENKGTEEGALGWSRELKIVYYSQF
ncbi:hypothetical protein QA601_10840 [Chitinispirillales bacterium ANBcel5]|uniref:hypothetical protein n=1 Tax=Cellulosispirillum alkaliphilum TaxID=3039283 RepID=UPI002A566195|nr:hypothetical protein [Chitinispirillales bacterium ANBcel5]